MTNQTCPLIIRDLYLYDFKSAFPRILESIDWSFEDIDLDDKQERNIFIGKAQQGNENLSSYLNNSVTSLLDFYITENNIDKDSIIVTQKDGFISTKRLEKTDNFMKLDFRYSIDFLILTPDRKKFLYTRDNEVTVKGISCIYDKLFSIYNRFANLSLCNKKTLFKQLEFIKQDVHNQPKEFYMIPVDDDAFVVQMKKLGPIKIKDSVSFSKEDVNTEEYFNHYFSEFMKSLFIEFV